MTRTTPHKWTFPARFRRGAFGWKSALPIQRLKEAVTEIRQVARREPVLAADGAVSLLEKLSAALEQVDSSSGAIGTAVNRAIDALVPVIARIDVLVPMRERWLERLFEALQNDQMPYIERLGDYWGELCVTPAIASAWVDRLLPITARVMGAEGLGEHFAGTIACLSALNAARRHEELLALVNGARLNWWMYRQYGVDALIALGRSAEALRYAEASRGLNAPAAAIAHKCEAILLASGMKDEAYRRYAIEANQASTHLATFRAIAKKYPDMAPASILHDLIASSPGAEGKWFAAAKDAGLLDLAASLAMRSPTDPRTLTRAARDFTGQAPAFAVTCGTAALHWMAAGFGYDITGSDVLDAYGALADATLASGMTRDELHQRLRDQFTLSPGYSFVASVLAHHVAPDRQKSVQD
ncbi:hypothetical protein P3T23_009456 [Paraburkholderia sp. GAS448]|uniref:hypothetical protein n=1 Tax=Paraburkholderia sp. GAS448 TaxID=3035136 RepID=UPI003D22A6BC